MLTTSCANCGYHFREGDIYCSQCSQKIDTHKLTVPHLFHELFHAVTHADKGILVLMKNLATNPGLVAGEYAEGKRRKHFNPFTFVLICLSLFVLINSTFQILDTSVHPDPAIMKQLPTKEAQDKYIGLLTRSAEVNQFITKRSNLIYLLAIPFYSVILWLFFRRKSYAEHLVASMYFNAFLALATSLVLIPLISIGRSTVYNVYFMVVVYAVQICYLSWAYYGFLGLKRRISFGKVFFTVFLAMMLWSIITGAIAFYYIFGDKAWLIVQQMIKQYLG
jgi:hypothetical protein